MKIEIFKIVDKSKLFLRVFDEFIPYVFVDTFELNHNIEIDVAKI